MNEILWLRIILLMGVAGHALNMYCDRTLSIFPNGTLSFANIKDIGKGDMAAKLMDGVPAERPMRSGVWGVFAIVLEFFGYLSLAVYTYQSSHIYGVLLFLVDVFFCIVAAGYHVKTALAEYVFIKLGRDERAKNLMLALMQEGSVMRICFISLIGYIVILIIAIVTGAVGFPIWAVIFTVLPVFIVLMPFRIIGSLHISAMISMLVWMLLV